MSDILLQAKVRINEKIAEIEEATGKEHPTLSDGIQYLISLVKSMLQARTISFQGNRTIESVILDCKGMTSLSSTFYGCTKLKTVELKNTQNVTSWAYTFADCTALVNIIGEIDFSSMTQNNSMFDSGGYNLVNFKVVPNTIKLGMGLGYLGQLSDESIQSIIDGLCKDETTNRTIKFNDAVKSKLTDEQIATITNKNWTVA